MHFNLPFKDPTMADSTTTLKDLKAKMAAFVKERDWEQFHSPKNLSMSIAIEAAELMEKFQWCADTQASKEALANDFQEVKHELADVMCYLLSFCNQCDIDISDAVSEKLKLNAIKYPACQVQGSYKKAEILKNSIKKTTENL